MKLKEKINDLLFPNKTFSASDNFLARDNLFSLSFDPNWQYSVKGNSFYSFSNEVDELNGALQISLLFNENKPTKRETVADFIKEQEKEDCELTTTTIAGYQTIIYSKNYEDSNMNFHYWYIYKSNILFIATFMIRETETFDTISNWLLKIEEILNTLSLNAEQFNNIKLK